MVKRFYIIRHGETDFNKNGMVQGSGVDSSLNDTGRQQAQQFFDFYKDLPIDKIYTSSLKRTTETVQAFINQGVKSESLHDLREISWGEQEGVAFTPDSSVTYQKVVKEWRNGNLTKRIKGGETPSEVVERQKRAFDYITGQENEDEVLICIHGRAMRILFCWMLNYPLHFMDNFHHTNTGMYVVKYIDGIYSIEVFNYQVHLSHEK